MLDYILVVDDEVDLETLIRQRFRKRIKANEVQLFFAQNGKEALDLLSKEPKIKVVLCDINMPVMDGLTFLAELKKLDRLTKVVMVTAYGDMKNIRTAMNHGAYDFLVKPIDFADLETTIDKTLKEVRLLHQSKIHHEQLIAIQQELTDARRIQQTILPERVPNIQDLEINVHYLPMEKVGGDFYDFHVIEPDKVGILIADVCGHGIPAALIASMVKTAFSMQKPLIANTQQMLTEINRWVFSRESRFVTAGYLFIDVKEKILSYSNAGHPPLYIWNRQHQQMYALKPKGTVLGFLEENYFSYETYTIQPGDRIFLYTDFILEATNMHGELFEEERFIKLIQEYQHLSSSDFIDLVLSTLRQWTHDKDRFDDDFTIVIIDVLGE